MLVRTRGTSSAVATILLIVIAIGAVSAAAAYTQQSSSVAARNIEVTIDGMNFSRARSGTDIWLFSMNVRNTGSVPVVISGTVTGLSVDQGISHSTLDPGSRGTMSYVWAVNAAAGEKYVVNFAAQASEGSTKRYTALVLADG